VGSPPPLEDPPALLDWYRLHYGREPNKKILAAARAMQEEEEGLLGGEGGLDFEAEPIDRAPLALIQQALALLGLSQNIARLAEETEQAWANYQAATRGGEGNADVLRKRWRDMAEDLRTHQKSADAVALALELLKEWVRSDWEERSQRIRRALNAAFGAEEVAKVLADEDRKIRQERAGKN
jgi:hypothetical protein